MIETSLATQGRTREGLGPVVIRIHRCRVARADDWQFVQGIRETAIPQVARVEGIEFSAFGRRIEGGGNHYVNVTVWRDYDALRKLTGEDVQSRLIFDGNLDLITEDSVEFFEVFASVDPQDLVERPDL